MQLEILSGFLYTRSEKIVTNVEDLQQVIRIYAKVIKKCIEKIYK